MIFQSNNNSDALYVSFNDELRKVSEWLSSNGFRLNADKSCYMIISNKKIEESKIDIAGKEKKRAEKV